MVMKKLRKWNAGSVYLSTVSYDALFTPLNQSHERISFSFKLIQFGNNILHFDVAERGLSITSDDREKPVFTEQHEVVLLFEKPTPTENSISDGGLVSAYIGFLMGINGRSSVLVC